MKALWRVTSVLLLGLTLSLVVRSEVPSATQREINYLLEHIERSECEFYRNGTWHDARAAAAHLRQKYESLVAWNAISSAEDFIDKAATASSLSGSAYEVRCSDGESVMSNTWLREALTRYRTSQ